MSTDTNTPQGPARRPDGSQRFPFPHLQTGDVIYGFTDDMRFRTANTTTACGETVAATLTTRRTDLVKCERCLTSIEAAP